MGSCCHICIHGFSQDLRLRYGIVGSRFLLFSKLVRESPPNLNSFIHVKHYAFSLFFSTCLLLTSCSGNKTGDKEELTSDSFESSEIAVTEIPWQEIDLKGIWTSGDNPFYPSLEFKGKSTVVLKTIMGSFATSYERDEEFIRVKTDKSDLLFEVVSEDSIVGSGFAKGLWIKQTN